MTKDNFISYYKVHYSKVFEKFQKGKEVNENDLYLLHFFKEDIESVFPELVKTDDEEYRTMKFVFLLGPNTKQWWVYEETNDVYIDPSNKVHEHIKTLTDTDAIEDYLLEEVMTKPSWLFNRNHWYYAKEI